MNSASQGDKALAASDCPGAIKHFTQALVELPRAPAYYIKRSTAYTRLKLADGGPNSQAALRDAETALILARDRGKRELILSAQMRRGVSLFQLGRYADAAFVFDILKEKTGAGASGDKGREEEVKDAIAGSGRTTRNGYEQELPIWEMKVKGQLKKLAEGDERGVVAVEEYPGDVKMPSEKDIKAQLDAMKAGSLGAEEAQGLVGKGKTPVEPSHKPTSAASASTPSAVPSTAPVQDKVRHEWYQSQDSVVVTLYVKGVHKDKVDSDLQNTSVCPLRSLYDKADSLYSYLSNFHSPQEPAMTSR